jgi:hypothetical protein
VVGFLQGLLLRGERTEVTLTYHDDAVIAGLGLGAAVWAALLAAPFIALALERRRARPPRPPPPGA